MIDRTTILRCEVGSTAHGTGLPGKEDLDEMAIAVPDPDYVTGLLQWEQDIIREDNGRMLGPNDRSTPDTYEITIYSLEKWMRLATQGNPSILLMLWAPVREVTPEGEMIRELAPRIVSRLAIPRFAGYMRSQALRLVGGKGSGHGKRGGGRREDVIAEHSWDTKFGMHMLRLGYQGLELMQTGEIQLPMQGEGGDFCRAVRRGEVPVEDAFSRAVDLYEQLMDPDLDAVVRDRPDMDAINAAMQIIYRQMWDW